MLTTAARLANAGSFLDPRVTVFPLSEAPLPTRAGVQAQIDARRWQRVGRAIVSHNGPLTGPERRRAALLNCGPRALLTSFTATQAHGLTGWNRNDVHVLVPSGTHINPHLGLRIRVHYVGAWASTEQIVARKLHALVPALLCAAGSLTPRSACALLAAAVQQRLTTATALISELLRTPRQKHRQFLIACSRDIGQGSHALSEIDFVRLCRRNGLPPPHRQAVRMEPSRRRRYLDADWDRTDGRNVGVEVDGAFHLAPTQWYADQMRQNELVIGGTTVLRFPSVVVRAEETLVADQLRRALGL